MACVYNHADDPFGVPQSTSPEKHLIWVKWDNSSISELEIALKLVQVFIWGLTVNLSSIEVLHGILLS